MLKARQCVREMRVYHSPLCGPEIDLRLDLNESTTGCSPRVLAKIRSLDAKLLALYPDRESGEKLLSDFLGVKAEELLLTNGADEGIDLLCRAYLDSEDELIIIVPAFAMYEVFAQSTGARIVRVSTAADLSFSVEKVLQAITPRTRMIVITNPNNPTGLAVDRADILRVLQAAPSAAVLLDEAYFDFYGQTMMDQIGKIPNLFIARTFSKAYGLAGMRLGALVGAVEQMSVVRRIIAPFNVNAFAIECLKEALDDRQFVANYVEQVRSTRESLGQQLDAMGLKYWPSFTNFLLVNFRELRQSVLDTMTARGIALRDRPDCPGCIRISIGTPPEIERMVSVLKEIMVEKPVVQQVAK
ncbi:MAG TPA: histidinol-phosphate transaminase [Candidatus Angelobacter sp.]|nr:histidinol-phosphate transaminase [Candidatus Angelobacter sp.]